MSDVGSLIGFAQERGLRVFLEKGRVKVKAPKIMDGETKALIEELREHKEEIKSILADEDPIPQDLISIRAWEVDRVHGEDGRLLAVKICSAVLQAHLWVIWDGDFQPKDDLAVYYPEEIPLLKGKCMEDLKLIQKTKLIFPGCRVIQ